MSLFFSFGIFVVLFFLMPSTVWSKSPPLFPIREKEAWGLINEEGQVVVKPKFAEIGGFDPAVDRDERVVAVKKRGKKITCGFLGPDGKERIPFRFSACKPFSEGMAAVKNEKGWFFIDRNGAPLFATIFLETGSLEGGRIFAATRNEAGHIQWGILDAHGQWVLEPQFSRVFSAPADPYLIAGTPAQWGIFSTEANRWLLSPRFDAILPGGEKLLRFLDVNGKWGFMTQNGVVEIPARFSEAYGFSDGLACVEYEKKMGFINRKGAFVIEPRFGEGGYFREGLAFVKEKAGLNARGGYINKDGHFVIAPKFLTGTPFSRGLAAVQVGYESWGLIDASGNWVLEPKYSAIGGWHQPSWLPEHVSTPDFRYGLVMVEEEGKRVAYVNRQGKIIWKGK